MSSATVEISRKEYEGMKETIEVLQDSQSMEAISEGLQQLKDGRVEDWDSVKDDLDI